MIVKNEAEILEAAIDRVSPFVDEIVIVDTGSTDDTLKIAHKLADQVDTITWNDDFSQARNYANSLASCEYILNLDADELVVNPEFFPSFRNCQDTFFYIEQENYLCSKNRAHDYEYYRSNGIKIGNGGRIALFPNDHTYHYEGIVHEKVVDKKHRSMEVSPLTLKCINICSPDVHKDKLQYYQQLGLKQLTSRSKEAAKEASNVGNLVINHLVTCIGHSDMSCFDTFYEEHKQLLFTCFSNHLYCRYYMQVLRKLLEKRFYARAKRLIDDYRRAVCGGEEGQSGNGGGDGMNVAAGSIDTAFDDSVFSVYLDFGAARERDFNVDQFHFHEEAKQAAIRELVMELDETTLTNDVCRFVRACFYRFFDSFAVTGHLTFFNAEMIRQLSCFPLTVKIELEENELNHENMELIKKYNQITDDIEVKINMKHRPGAGFDETLKRLSKVLRSISIAVHPQLLPTIKRAAELQRIIADCLDWTVNFTEANHVLLKIERIPLCLIAERLEQYLFWIKEHREIDFSLSKFGSRKLIDPCSGCIALGECGGRLYEGELSLMDDVRPMDVLAFYRIKRTIHYFHENYGKTNDEK